ncbi:chromate efflux transporter [Vitiosangium sp. GDMCC 1.1324]|uniref:chromate efflux transporter n=1 Tax=Vitiosangium sp. (strain GDMCC 1.1324) TaxID=2138576 RepID=UPI001E32B81B|nr:chromate efflux transporter [Vitiosangium sp. GDMCC 1.1324]
MTEATYPPPDEATPRARALRELALLFLRLGTTAFGGPAAHIALMEDEVVRRRKWLTHEEFLDLLGAANLIPGPNSTELAIHIGHRRAGWSGLVVAGTCFILPAFLIVSAIGWVYTRYGQLPEVGHLLYGVKPVIIAVVLQAIWGLTRGAVKSKLLAVVGVACVALGFLGVNELLLLLLAGGFVALSRRVARSREGGGVPPSVKALVPGLPLGAVAAATAAPGFSLGGLFLFFLKVGSVLYGSGYVLLAFLRADLVERWGWLTEAQLLDAVAVGQVTPGPVFTTATFIGYVLGGFPGGVVATVGIFLPAFFFVAVSGPLVPRMRRSWVAGAFLDGVNVASLALMATVTWQLGRSALVDVWTVGLALVSAVLLIRYRVNSAWLVLGGAALGLLVG